jgi:hypothetical protein
MALHTELKIYKAAHALTTLASRLVAHMPRNHRSVDGALLVGHSRAILKHIRHSVTRRRTVNEGLRRVAAAASTDVYARANSYFGLLRQASASHHDRARLANVVRDRGHAADAAFTKTFRRSAG